MYIIMLQMISISCPFFQIQWVGWMDDQPEYVVDPAMRFSDIIVPTIDTVRGHFLLEHLVSNFKPVRS